MGRNDRWRAQATARDLEERYGLYRVGPSDRTANKRPHSVEVNKAMRTGRREVARDQLRREVRYAAAVSGSADEFFELLRQAGVQVRLRHSVTDHEQVTGYAVALSDHTTAGGRPVWYGGGKLAPDLTLPQLRGGWGWLDAAPGGPAVAPLQQARVFEQAAAQVRAAAEDIRRLSDTDPDAAGAAAYAAADTLTVTARLVEGDRCGPLHRAAEAIDRAAREPYRRPLPRTRRGEDLQSMSRLLRLAGRLSGDQALFTALRLIVDLSLLADSLADLRDAQHRLHQARAARIAARLLWEVGSGQGVVTPPRGSPVGVTAPPTPHRDPRRQGWSTTAGRTK